ncbi:MAG: sulfite dehydrogenase [Epsilonproteobacteria bacterium]|nr:MAG: sulfite dehydrogenase [Campylobacterota bacterium]
MKIKKDELIENINTVDPQTKRREFLKKGVVLSTAAIASLGGIATNANAKYKIDKNNLPPNNPAWGLKWGRDTNHDPYGSPSKFEKHVVRREVPWLTADKKASVSFTPWQDLKGIIVPNGLHFTRCHGGVIDINPKEYRLLIHGLVKKDIILTLEDIKRYPSVSVIHSFECAANNGMEWRGANLNSLQATHGMLACSEVTGVPLRTILEDVGLKKGAKWMFPEGSDPAGVGRSIPIEKVLDDAILVYAQNGEALRPEQGYPVRLFLPGWEGVMQIKWLRRLKFDTKSWMVREESTKYTMLTKDGHALMYNWAFSANSVITSPCPERDWRDKKRGFIMIEGIAWSGKGTITAVDVSIDGGKTWKLAQFTSMQLPKAVTRFAFKTKWNKNSMMIQSRATDDTGFTQPTATQLNNARGKEGIYHRNAIQTWEVKSNGEVNNVHIYES